MTHCRGSTIGNMTLSVADIAGEHSHDFKSACCSLAISDTHSLHIGMPSALLLL
jgi:hypothetical protein